MGVPLIMAFAFCRPPVIVSNFCGTKTETNLQSIYHRLL